MVCRHDRRSWARRPRPCPLAYRSAWACSHWRSPVVRLSAHKDRRRKTARARVSHRQLERSAEDRGNVVRPVFDQLFQEGLDRCIVSSVHSLFSMVVLQLHGIPEWIAPAGAGPGRGLTAPSPNEFPDLRLQYRLFVTIPAGAERARPCLGRRHTLQTEGLPCRCRDDLPGRRKRPASQERHPRCEIGIGQGDAGDGKVAEDRLAAGNEGASLGTVRCRSRACRRWSAPAHPGHGRSASARRGSLTCR